MQIDAFNNVYVSLIEHYSAGAGSPTLRVIPGQHPFSRNEQGNLPELQELRVDINEPFELRSVGPFCQLVSGPLTNNAGVMYCFVVTYRSERPQPKDCFTANWPLGDLLPDAPPAAAAARWLAVRLAEEMQKPKRRPRTARSVAAVAGIAPATVTGILNGERWCDIDTLARLERALNAKLWGNDHRKK